MCYVFVKPLIELHQDWEQGPTNLQRGPLHDELAEEGALGMIVEVFRAQDAVGQVSFSREVRVMCAQLAEDRPCN